MNKLKNKLKSNKGSSILLALGLMMICTMISSAVIVAAAGGSSRSINRVERQRAYLAISSAAQLIMDEMQEAKQYVGREEYHDYVCNEYTEEATIEYTKSDNSKVEHTGWVIPSLRDGLIIDAALHADEMMPKETYVEDIADPNFVVATNLQGALAEIILESSEQIYLENASFYENEFTISLEDLEEKLPDVDCKYSMDSNYNIKIEIKLADDSEYDYSMTVKADASRQTDVKVVTEGEDALSCKHDVRYNAPTADNSSFVYAESDDMLMAGERTIYTFTVTWENKTLVKGVAEP